jgi:hypothetical protein
VAIEVIDVPVAGTLNPNPALIVATSQPKYRIGIAGETILAGKAVRYVRDTGKWILSDNTSYSSTSVDGIAACTSHNGQPLSVQISGELFLDAGVFPGTVYCAGEQRGSISPLQSLGIGQYITIIGIGMDDGRIALQFKATDETKPS